MTEVHNGISLGLLSRNVVANDEVWPDYYGLAQTDTDTTHLRSSCSCASSCVYTFTVVMVLRGRYVHNSVYKPPIASAVSVS